MAVESVASPPGAATPGTGLAPGLAAWLDELAGVAARAAELDLSRIDGPAAASVHDALRRAVDQLGALRARLTARIREDGRWAVGGSARTLPEWMAGRGGMSVGTARREVALGQLLDVEAPAVASAVAEGDISLAHAEVISRRAATSDARRAALASDRDDRNQAYLVEAARRMTVDQFDRFTRRWAAAVDTASHEAEEVAVEAREYLTLTPRSGGLDLRGFLAPENAEALRTALRAVAGVPAADDPRTPERRRAEALGSLARIVLDQGLAGAGRALVRPHLLVHVPFETYAALAADRPHDDAGRAVPGTPAVAALTAADGTLGAPAELDDGTPLTLSSLARLACDAQLTRVVMDPQGQPLDVGRAQRTYTGAQRWAVVARDKRCRYPGCDAAPVLCEVHHIRWWSRGGETSVSNGILLCRYHHHEVHRKAVLITAAFGRFRFTKADGTPIGRGDGGGRAEPERAVGGPTREADRSARGTPEGFAGEAPEGLGRGVPVGSARGAPRCRDAPGPDGLFEWSGAA